MQRPLYCSAIEVNGVNRRIFPYDVEDCVLGPTFGTGMPERWMYLLAVGISTVKTDDDVIRSALKLSPGETKIPPCSRWAFVFLS